MAYFRFNSGATSEVDDEELMELIKAGAGTEVDAPNPTAGAEHVTLEHPTTVVMGKDKSLQARMARALEAPWRDEMMPEGGYPFAPGSPNILQRGYQGGKDLLSFPLAGLEGVAMMPLNAVGNAVLGREDHINPLETAKTAYSKRNEGLRSFGNDPINAALLASNFVPGLGFLTDPIAVTRLGKYGSLAAGVVRDASIGAGTGFASTSLDPNAVSTPGEAAVFGAGLGGTGALAGGLMRNWGKSNVPGLGSKHNLKVPEEAKELYRQNADAVLSQGFFPKGREGFLKLSEGLQSGAGAQYEDAMTTLEKAKPDLRFSVPEWEARARQQAYKSMGDFSEPGLVLDDSPLGYKLNDIAEGIFTDKLNAIRASKLKATPRPWETPEGAANWDPAMIMEENARIANELTPRQLSLARTGTTDPIVYQNPVAEVSRYRRKAGHGLHDAANDMLMEHPEYSTALGVPSATDQIFRKGSAPQRYKLGATIENITNSPGAIGLGHRLPFGLAIDPWLWGSGLYKTGNAIDHPGVVTAGMGLYNGYRGLTGGIPVREMEAEPR